MNKRDEKIKQELIAATKAVRKKYTTLKLGQAQENVRLEEAFKPITEPLKEIIKQSKRKGVKEEIKSEKYVDVKAFKTTPKQEVSFLPTEAVAESTPFVDDDDDDDVPSLQNLRESVTGVDERVFQTFLEQYDPLPRVYLEKLIKDDEREIDYTYGVHYEQLSDKWVLGNTPFTIDGSDIIINNVKHKGTPGLYELIFMKIPSGYKDKDVEAYRKIMEETNLYKQRFETQGRVKSNKGYKYVNIIKPILESTPVGKTRGRRLKSWAGAGIMSYNEKPLEYVYWNDAVELVRRLRLLWASKQAGNNNHNNEIQSIIEELREEGIIY